MEKGVSKKVVILGGDERQNYLADFLEEKGYTVTLCGTKLRGRKQAENRIEAVAEARIVVGPTPFTKDGITLFGFESEEPFYISEFMGSVMWDQIVFAGAIPLQVKEYCKENNIYCFDFMDDEVLAFYNAIATAEGIIAQAILNQPTNLDGSQSLVLGFGKCGKVLAGKLKNLGAKVTIGVRRMEVFPEILEAGFIPIKIGEGLENMGNYEYIFNTVPEKIIDETMIENIGEKGIFLDIASGQGGIAHKVAKEKGKNVWQFLGLPGKYAPKSTAMALADNMNKIIRKLENEEGLRGF